MKKRITVFAIGVLSILSLAAQDQKGLFSVAANLNYASQIESIGMGLRMQCGFTEYIRASTEYKYYLSNKNTTAWEINADGHYVMEASESLSLYPIGGVKLAQYTLHPASGLNPILEKTSTTYVGFNFGWGAQIAFKDKLFFQPELKYELLQKHNQWVFSVGLMYQF